MKADIDVVALDAGVDIIAVISCTAPLQCYLKAAPKLRYRAHLQCPLAHRHLYRWLDRKLRAKFSRRTGKRSTHANANGSVTSEKKFENKLA
jgi:hypothetical protein